MPRNYRRICALRKRLSWVPWDAIKWNQMRRTVLEDQLFRRRLMKTGPKVSFLSLYVYTSIYIL